MQSTLILNASYEPLNIVPASRAIALILKGEATAMDESDVVFTYANGEFNIPYVIRLNEYRHIKRTNLKEPSFSRAGILARDGRKCAYCGKHAETIDHVVPRMLGGQNSYENCVAACSPCNRKKGHKTLKEMGWTLNVTLAPPSPMVRILMRATGRPQEYKAWSEYIFMFEPNLKKAEQLVG